MKIHSGSGGVLQVSGISGVAVVALCAPASAQGGPHVPLQRVQASTLFGGLSRERCQGVSVLQNGDILIAGETDSNFLASQMPQPPRFPNTQPYHDHVLGGQNDAYVAILDPLMKTIKSWNYVGGDGDDRAYFAMQAPAPSTKIWVVGFTHSTQGSGCLPSGLAPTTVAHCYKNGACDQCTAGGSTNECFDVFVARFSSTLSALESYTVVGGSRHDTSRGNMTVDSSGNVYVCGFTTSGPVGGQPFYTTLTPPNASTMCSVNGTSIVTVRDAFAFKLDLNGTLVWSTCFGGAGDDFALANPRVDEANNWLWIAGGTTSTSIPGLIAGQNLNGVADGFIAKLDRNTGAVIQSRFIGGSGRDSAAFNDCMELDPQGRPVVSGTTRSADFPTTTAPQLPALWTSHSKATPADIESDGDIFVTIFDKNSLGLYYSTYLNGGLGGATEREEPAGLAVDSFGDVYISGETLSDLFPTTIGAWDTVRTTGTTCSPAMCPVNDAFLTRLIPGVASLAYSTFLGGDTHVTSPLSEVGTRGRSVSILPAAHPYAGSVIVSGVTTTRDFFTKPTSGVNKVVFELWLGVSPNFDHQQGWVQFHNASY